MSRRNSAKGKSQHFRDPFKAMLKGYSKRLKATYGGEYLFVEARDLQNFFQPYHASMERSLHFVHRDPEVMKVMEAHFLGHGYGRNPGIDLQFVYKLMHLIGYMHESNAFFGSSFSEVVWDEIEIDKDRKWILPVALRFIPTETMRRKRDGTYVQHYSLITRLGVFEPFKYRTTRFNEDEIFMLVWPFGKNDVWEKVKHVYSTKSAYMQRGLKQSEASVKPDTKSFQLLKASQSSNKEWKFKVDSAQLKEQRIMRLLAHTYGFAPTKFYDAFLLFQCVIDRAYALKVYIDAFNKQVMENIAKKNNWDIVPLLTYTGKYQEKIALELFEKLQKKEISYEAFIEQIIEKD